MHRAIELLQAQHWSPADLVALARKLKGVDPFDVELAAFEIGITATRQGMVVPNPYRGMPEEPVWAVAFKRGATLQAEQMAERRAFRHKFITSSIQSKPERDERHVPRLHRRPMR